MKGQIVKPAPQTIDEYLSTPDCQHSIDGQMGVNANAVYLPKSKNIINIYLTPEQALRAARNLLHKAEMLIANNVQDAAVQLWVQPRKDKSGRLDFGIVKVVQKNTRDP